MYRLIPIFLSFLLMGAHFLRFQIPGLALMCVSAPLALLIKRKWIVKVFSILLFFMGLDWLSTAYGIWIGRQAAGESATRMLIILSGIALFTACSSLLFKTKKMKERYSANANAALPGTIAFFLTFITLSYIAVIDVKLKVFLFERFLFGASFIEAFWLAIYAGLLADFMPNILVSQYLRRRIWLFLSVLFFLQLVLGLFGLSSFLQSGALTIPVPLLIVAEPIFNNGGLILLALFAASLILTGPAWCSFLCYFGAVDNLAACNKKTPDSMPKWRNSVRFGILAIIILAAVLLRYLGAKTSYAACLASIFGLGGVGVILFLSRKTGVMTYCTGYCPVGAIATVAGKLNPFRVRIDDTCDSCGDCTPLCKYDALSASDIERKKPAYTCTLCGDCLSACEKQSIDYSFPLLSPKMARTIFVVIVISLHAIMIGLVRP